MWQIFQWRDNVEWFLLHFSFHSIYILSFLSFSMPNYNNSLSEKTVKFWALSLKLKMQRIFFSFNRFSIIILTVSYSSWSSFSKLLWNNHGCYYTHLQMWFQFSGTPLHFEWELDALKDLTSQWKMIKARKKMKLKSFFRTEISSVFHATENSKMS